MAAEGEAAAARRAKTVRVELSMLAGVKGVTGVSIAERERAVGKREGRAKLAEISREDATRASSTRKKRLRRPATSPRRYNA
jgi:hypothetical protein